ncbi:M20/M25/M40 family metallo-hydrolase [Emticicia sp. CRIBPO]|uniref:M20 family metallo-hydrolase n=1 Tax=Emticicia sp. CRIBPO TaxID=2683258 RepID=UPI001412A5D2|nr:M20 family metallo-hydrolase [Emticicia sp. CRIBPO]NBA86586.1 M20/M25/M40 family metallo-hydrolase [Emticicia sp. CRIBPO]
MSYSSLETINTEVVELLKKLIATPSFSREEDKTADILQLFLESKDISVNRLLNNIWAKNLHFDENLPTILLNSHHDTVKPNISWTYDPFLPVLEGDKLTGLGSNDAGGPLVSLLGVFLFFYDRSDLKYNLIFAASAEEEISGKNGIELLLSELPVIDFGIVGEPTQMNLAVAEKGLMVLDCVAEGKSGHAARNEGENAIYKALQDIEWFRTFEFPVVSESLGPVKMSVTQINAGTQHNVVPDECKFVVDIRATDAYSLEQTLEMISSHIRSKVTPRSVRLKPSGIPPDHPIVKAGVNLGRTTYGSPTLSDQALMDFPTLKIGPGDSARSHTANEFIYISEIEKGIEIYKRMLEQVIL